jgi:hypothetical protein
VKILSSEQLESKWVEHWRTRPKAKDIEAHYIQFWDSVGGRDLYFDQASSKFFIPTPPEANEVKDVKMLSKGDRIDWDEFDSRLAAHLLNRPETQSDFATMQMFWESNGGFSSFFTLIDKTMYRNDQFDIPVLREDVLARDTPIKAGEIDWHQITEDWEHWWETTTIVNYHEAFAAFLDARGGEDLYFTRSRMGFPIMREYFKGKEPVGIGVSKPTHKGKKKVVQFTLNVSEFSQRLYLGENYRILTIREWFEPDGSSMELWVEIDDGLTDRDRSKMPATYFYTFLNNQPVRGDLEYVDTIMMSTNGNVWHIYKQPF